jgi:NADH-quinone oxidoreductase subunit A
MFDFASQTDPRIALALYLMMVIIAVVGILVVARLLRNRAIPPVGSGIYESGAPAHLAMTTPVPAAYFQIAAFFVIFDFEAAVLYTWSISVEQAGMPGLISAAVFIVVLLLALVYLWADGALDTGPKPRGELL